MSIIDNFSISSSSSLNDRLQLLVNTDRDHHDRSSETNLRQIECKRSVVMKVSPVLDEKLNSRLHEAALWMNMNIEEQRNKVQVLIKDYEQLYNKYEDNKKFLATINQENVRLRGDKYKIKAIWKNALKDLLESKKQYCELSCEKKSVEKQNETLLRNAKTNMRSIEQLNELVSIKDKDIKTVQRELDDMTQKSNKREDAVLKLECQVSSLKMQLNNLNEEYEDQIKLLDVINTAVKNDLSKCLEEMNNMKSKIVEKEIKLEETSVEMSTLQHFIEELKKAKEADQVAIKNFIHAMESENKSLKRELMMQEKNVQEKQAEIKSLQQSTNELRECASQERTHYERSQNELNCKTKQIELLEKDVHKLKKKLLEVMNQIINFKNENLAKQIEQSDKMKTENPECENVLNELVNEIDSMKNALKDFQNKRAALTSQNTNKSPNLGIDFT